jgi:hypothetical protein
MSYYLSVIKDHPSGFWKLDESSGFTAYDSSGCGNNGTYFGTPLIQKFPLVEGGSNSTKITNNNYLEFNIVNDFSGITGIGGFGTTKTSDNDFSLEIWFHPKNVTEETPIFADTNGVGLYWDKGNLVFKLEDEILHYSVPNYNRSMHIVAVYNLKSMTLYINGNAVASKSVSRINFTNESLSFYSGPASLNEYFLIDAPAIYRYSLTSEKALNHFNSFMSNTESNIVLPDSGEIFKASERYQNINTTVAFPAQLDWEYHIDDDILYSESTNSLYLSPSSSSGEFIKVISLPNWQNYVSSKIEWLSSKGVSIDISTDGESGPWHECENGKALPGFSQGLNFLDKKVLCFKVMFNSEDSTIYIPELYYIKIHFYDEKKLLAHGGGSVISTSQPNSGSSWEISISNENSNILLRDSDNGITTKDSVFYIDTAKDIKSLEMILSPKSLSSGYLFYNKTGSTESYISWAADGTISKNNITGLFINGQDLSSVSNISSYLYLEDPNYILIKTTSSMTGQIWLNGKQDGGNRDGVLDDNMYQNIAIYESDLIDHQLHYELYTGVNKITVEDSVINITEEAVKTYSRDRVLLNNL